MSPQFTILSLFTADRAGTALFKELGMYHAAGQIENEQPAPVGRQSADKFDRFKRLQGAQRSGHRPRYRSESF